MEISGSFKKIRCCAALVLSFSKDRRSWIISPVCWVPKSLKNTLKAAAWKPPLLKSAFVTIFDPYIHKSYH